MTDYVIAITTDQEAVLQTELAIQNAAIDRQNETGFLDHAALQDPEDPSPPPFVPAPQKTILQLLQALTDDCIVRMERQQDAVLTREVSRAVKRLDRASQRAFINGA